MTLSVLFICMSAFLDRHLTLKCGSHSWERTPALDFKSTSASWFGDSNVVFCLFLVMNIKRYCLSIISRNAKWKEFVLLLIWCEIIWSCDKKLDKKAIKGYKCVSVNKSKTTLLWPNLWVVRSLWSLRQMLSLGYDSCWSLIMAFVLQIIFLLQ